MVLQVVPEALHQTLLSCLSGECWGPGERIDGRSELQNLLDWLARYASQCVLLAVSLSWRHRAVECTRKMDFVPFISVCFLKKTPDISSKVSGCTL